jgi:CheY-like chemotaxis protein
MAKRCDRWFYVPQPFMESDPSLPLVLIVDDDEADRLLAQRALRRIGVRNPVKVFAGGEEFMEFVRQASAQVGEEGRIAACVVFVDLKMPPPDGFEVLSWVRTQPALSHLQVVVLTGSIDPQDMRRAAELRANLYLPKFPSDETLARVVSKASASAVQALRFASGVAEARAGER